MIPAQPHSTSAHRHQGAAPWPAEAWQRELKRSIRSTAELRRILGVAAERDVAAGDDFPVRVPRPYIARMRRGDPEDPLLRQVLPSGLEAESVPGFRDDALAEAEAIVDTGLLQKYAGRALLIASGSLRGQLSLLLSPTLPVRGTTGRPRASRRWRPSDRIRASGS